MATLSGPAVTPGRRQRRRCRGATAGAAAAAGRRCRRAPLPAAAGAPSATGAGAPSADGLAAIPAPATAGFAGSNFTGPDFAAPDFATNDLAGFADEPVVVADGGGPAPGAPVILELRAVRKEYPVTAGAVMQRKVGPIQAVRGVDLDATAGRDPGSGGGVRLREVDPRADDRGPGAPDVGLGPVRRDGPDQAERRRAAPAAPGPGQLMFQDPYSSLDPRMRVGSIIREPLVVQGIGNADEQHERVAALLREVGLPPHAVELYPHEFSGGQRQRIGLARALALNPRLIVTDEPVSALDVSIRSQILNLMKRLQANYGLTYVFISHDLSVVRYLADRIAVMYLGKLVEIGSGDDIYARPAHPYTAGLIALDPRAQPHGATVPDQQSRSPGNCRRRSTRPRVARSAPGAPMPSPAVPRRSRLSPPLGLTTWPPASTRCTSRSSHGWPCRPYKSLLPGAEGRLL